MSSAFILEDGFNGVSEDSDVDEKIRRLEDEISIKNNEINDLNNQVLQVSQLTDKLERAQNEVNRLNSEKADLKRAMDDLTNRLQISCDTNSQLQSQLNAEKANYRDLRHEEIENAAAKFADKEKLLQGEITRLEQELEASKARCEQMDIEAKTFTSKICRMLKSGSRFFDREIESINELQSMFDNNTFKTTPQQQTPSPKVDNSDANAKKYKQQRNEARKRIQELENAYQSLQESKAAGDAENERRCQVLKNQLEQSFKERDHLAELRTSEVRSLQQKLASVKADLRQKQLEIASFTPVKERAASPQQPRSAEKHHQTELRAHSEIPYSPNLPPLYPTDNVQSKIISTQKKQAREISDLQKKLDEKLNPLSASGTNDISKLQQLEDDYENLLLENQNLISNVQILENENRELQNNIDSLRNAINSLHTEEKREGDIHKKDYKAELKKYLGQIEELENRVLHLQRDNSKHEDTITAQKSAIEYEKSRADEAEEHNRRLTFDIHELRNRLESQPKIAPEDVLPPEAWSSVRWPTDVANEIDRVVSNSSLQAQSKLSHVFNIFKTFYEGVIEERECQLECSRKHCEDLKARINRFLIDISIAITDQSSTYEDLLNDNINNLIEGASSLRKQHDELQIYFNKLVRVVDHLKSLFNLQSVEDYDDVIAQIDEIFGHIQLQNGHVVDCHKKIKKLKAENEQTQNVTKKQVLELTKKNADLINQLEDAKALIEDRERELQIAREQVEALQAQLNESAHTPINRSTDSFTAADFKLPHAVDTSSRDIDSLHTQLEQKESQLHNQAVAANKRISELNTALEESATKIDDLESLVANLEEQNKQLERQVSDISERSKKRAKTEQEKYEKAKRDAEEAYAKSIQSLHKANETTRLDLENMAKELAKVSSENRAIKQSFAKLQKKQKKDHEECKRLRSSMEREKLVLDAQARTRIIDAQGEMNDRLIQEKNRYENEKRRIFNIFAEQFKEFFSPLRQIDEREFRVGVEKAHESYRKLADSDASIRNMLHAKNRQTTEDAVAQMFFTSREE